MPQANRLLLSSLCSLRKHAPLDELQGCRAWGQLTYLLRRMADSGRLRRLAAALAPAPAPQQAPATAAPSGARQAPAGASRPPRQAASQPAGAWKGLLHTPSGKWQAKATLGLDTAKQPAGKPGPACVGSLRHAPALTVVGCILPCLFLAHRGSTRTQENTRPKNRLVPDPVCAVPAQPLPSGRVTRCRATRPRLSRRWRGTWVSFGSSCAQGGSWRGHPCSTTSPSTGGSRLAAATL